MYLYKVLFVRKLIRLVRQFREPESDFSCCSFRSIGCMNDVFIDAGTEVTTDAVSYTHLDVYKRQEVFVDACAEASGSFSVDNLYRGYACHEGFVEEAVNFRDGFIYGLSQQIDAGFNLGN